MVNQNVPPIKNIALKEKIDIAVVANSALFDEGVK
jgi:hypothetical protein